MTKRKLLISTTNEGKYEEMKSTLETLPFELISLGNLPVMPPPQELQATLEKSLILKAKYYAEKTGLLTLADGMEQQVVCYDPEKKSSYITTEDATDLQGKAIADMKYHLQNTYCGKHIVVPFALIIKDGKVFMQMRNDPHRPVYHRKWEFPGGGMEMGETLEENLRREVKEETGYEVEIVKQLNYIGVEDHIAPTFMYQVYLIPFICKIVGGSGGHRDEEVLETKWFELDEVFDYDLLGDNEKIYRAILPELKSLLSTD